MEGRDIYASFGNEEEVKKTTNEYEIVPVEKKQVTKYEKEREALLQDHADFLAQGDATLEGIFSSAERIYQNNPDLKAITIGKMRVSEDIEPLRSGFFGRKTVYHSKRSVEYPEVRLERRD